MKNIGESTIKLGEKCKYAGKIGAIVALASFCMDVILIIIALGSGISLGSIIAIIIFSAFLAIGVILISFYFLGWHFICLGKIEINTNSKRGIVVGSTDNAIISNVNEKKAEEINRYNKLYEQGIIAKSDFERKKTEIMNRKD